MFEENPELFLDEIVKNVKEERIQRKISQLKLANILDFSSPNYIAKIETRKHGSSYNLIHLCKIAKAFDIEVVELLPQKKKKS
ncbi:helix-turn-helix transcriptional regulator [Aliarcobacter butzleri]|uniref:Helix-turn-helix transcriptional regulator n=1 Tax=Aliarcobacter butzleri TaxID=28197 RepID=A0AAW7Q8W5_9BACT|nr:helix-turn-helix transcriptional regulator [Aliarcobacter butzleri]MDN5108248.1 helix-turn-helix transcriptional regulator [Aliarcobacter butzleri]MDN5122677.1 helix-turn-helix transcriptional regulator [Aliarcobacter butzleri]